MKASADFQFKKFTIKQTNSAHKVGTDGVLLGTWVNVDQVSQVLDVGTGTGLIALIIAQRTDANTMIDAVEIQSEDFEQATENFKDSPWSDRLHPHHVPFQDFKTSCQYDLIVSNPPYFVNSWKAPDENRLVARHTSSLSFEDLASSSAKLLSSNGRLAVILPVVEAESFIKIARFYYFEVIRKTMVHSRSEKSAERCLLELSRVGTLSLSVDKLVIHSTGNEWSEEYKNLTRKFYLKL